MCPGHGLIMIIRHEPITDDDRAAVEAQAREFETFGASPTWPFVVGLVGVLAVAAAFQSVRATTGGAILLLAIPGSVLAVGGLLLAAGRKRFAQVMGAMANRLRRNLGDAEHVVVYEVEASAAHIVGGDSDAADEEWSGAVIWGDDGERIFVDVQVVMQFPRDAELVQHVPRQFVVRALPTHEVISVKADGDPAEETVELSGEEISRLAAWVRETDDEAPPCRAIPAALIEPGEERDPEQSP